MRPGIAGSAALIALVLAAVSLPGSVANVRADPQSTPQRPTFSVQVDLVSTDVIVRDPGGNFVSNLTRNDFEVYEDGVKQDVISLTLSHGGRITNILAPAPSASIEGIILPK